MALTAKRGWVLTAVGVGLVAVALLIVSLLQLQRSAHFNLTLKQEDYKVAAQDTSPYGVFASAYQHQQDNEFGAAIEQYSRIENRLDPEFQQRVRYNMATLYLQQAMVVRQAGDQDVAIPLIELAKHLYRELLRTRPENWSAKYNLEQALKLAPEIEEENTPNDVMPERSPEATGSMNIDRELP